MSTCENCKGKGKEASATVSALYAAHEMAAARLERTAKRLWITVLILIFLLVGSNAAWLWYESQWEVVETTTTYETNATDGGNAVINGNGSVNINGES